jgi:hypothetical protein
MDQQFLKELKNSTPAIQDLQTYMDADDEMLMIARQIVKENQHNEYVLPQRIKFLYSPKPKKDGGRYSLFDLIKRSEIEKMVNEEFDFIMTVFYDVWAKLDPEQKVIQLDKALCGIDMGDGESEKSKKKSPDSKEYVSNMLFYGAEKVMRISEIIDLSCATAVEERKEKEKAAKKNGKGVAEQINE